MKRKMYIGGAIALILSGALMAAPVLADEIEGNRDCYDVEGEVLTGWQEVDGDWFYFDADGEACTGWLTLGKQTYFFYEDGRMATGWLKDDGAYFYLDENGRRKTGWIQLAKGWYYLGKDGKMVTGWQQIGSKYYYFASSGLMQTGWLKNGRGWYYFDANGRMVTGWQEIKEKYYYFNADGLMQTGWVQSKGKYYFLDENGCMLTGWQMLSGKWYRFNKDGSRDMSIIDEDSADYKSLFAEGDGRGGFAETDRGFLRVINTSETDYSVEEPVTTERLFAIEYDSEMNFMGARIIPSELERYGGFYSGEDAYYFLFAANNTEEDDSKEVFRVVKYSKDWKRLGSAAITGDSGFGHEVRYPFSWGTLDMLEKNGILYIVCGHEGYVDESVGMGHQGLLVIRVDENELTGYISTANLWHSFSQNLALSEDGEIYMVEESEGSEATVVSWLTDEGTYHSHQVQGEYWYYNESEIIEVLKYGGQRTSAWAVATYATSNDIQVTGSNILTVGSSIDQSRYDDDTYKKTYNIYLTVTPRNDFSEEATTVRWITKDNCNGYSYIRLLKLNENRLLLVWRQSESETSVAASDDTDTMKDSVLHYVFLDGDGKTISKIFTASGRLSDAYPIVKGGNVIFTASDGSEVAFYTINGKNGAFSKKLVPYSDQKCISWVVKNDEVTLSGHGAVGSEINDRYYEDFYYSKALYIEEGVTGIPEFDSMPNLTKAVIPNSVTKLGNAFIGHQSSLDVYIPASVTSIGSDAFYRAWYWGGYRDKYNVTLYCEKDSYAAKFAADKGIAYTILNKPYDLAAWRNAAPAQGEWKKGQYYDASGKAYGSGTLSWKKNAKGWWVESSAGWYPKNEWVKIDGKWYFFDNRGYMAANAWQDGRWLSSNGAWTYLQRGAWKCNSKGWWYDDTSGWTAKNQWQKINGNWYFFDANGYMVTGDRTIQGKVYHFGSNGICQNP